MLNRTALTRLLRAAALVVSLAPLGCGGLQQQGPLTPLVVGWEQFFRLDWQVDQRGRQSVVWGHVLNDWGLPAARMRLLVEGLDTSGGIVGQKVAWVGSTLTPGTRQYFEVPVPWQAPTHRVSVFAFDWVLEANGSGRFFR